MSAPPDEMALFEGLWAGCRHGLMLFRPDGALARANAQAAIIAGGPPEDLARLNCLRDLPRVACEAYVRAFAGEPVETHFRHLTVTGGVERDLWIALQPVGGWVLTLVDDISEQVIRQTGPALTTVAFEEGEPAYLMDTQRHVVRINAALCALLGVDGATVVGAHERTLRAPGQDAEELQRRRDALCHAGEWRGELWLRRADGQPLRVLQTVTRLRARHGELGFVVGCRAPSFGYP
ncbi:MAG: PAS domain-containing protein [Myxococcales bacterium]|nr:PAS domain-containing protein [Myxococcales bacterium]